MVTVRIEKVSKSLQNLYHRGLGKPKGLKYHVVARVGKQGSVVLESHLAKNKVAAKRIQASLRKQYSTKKRR